MTLAILNLSGLGEAGWRPWFEAVLPDDTDWQVAEDPDDPPAADRYLLIYDAPDARFRRAMQDGVPFERIIADWTAHARQVLARWRKARRRLYLIDADAFGAAPEMLAESLGGWLGCDMGTPPAVDHDADAHPLAILAAQAAHCLDPVRQLADELEVGGMSPRLARQGSEPQLGAAYAALREQAAEADKSATQNRQLNKAKAKAKAAQADRTKARREAKALSAKLEKAAAETGNLQAELKARKDAIKAMQAEESEARKQIGTLNAKLEKAVTEAGRLRADLKAAQAGEAKTRKQVEALTAEAGSLGAGLKAEKDAAQALFHEEIELLQHQLMTVQQALEQEYRDGLALRKEAGSDRHQLRSDLDRMRSAAELEQLRLSTMLREQAEQIAALLEEQRTLTTELDRSREEVDALLASTSWRVTAPLRRARLAVAKPT